VRSVLFLRRLLVGLLPEILLALGRHSFLTMDPALLLGTLANQALELLVTLGRGSGLPTGSVVLGKIRLGRAARRSLGPSVRLTQDRFVRCSVHLVSPAGPPDRIHAWT